MTGPTAEAEAIPAPLIGRRLAARVEAALADTPVVFLGGPRQAGKTTLARWLGGATRRYLTLDDEITRVAAQQDPIGLVRGMDRAVIDEVQRAPALLLAIKKSIDEDRRPGRFLLTGSANLATLPAVADSLAGRIETLALLPLACCELDGGRGDWLDAVFGGRVPTAPRPQTGEALVERVLRGGYPEAVARTTARRRATWGRQYVQALVSRDARELAGIEKIDQSARLLKVLAHTAGRLCNQSRFGAEVGLDHKTAARYLTVFEQLYLLRRVPVWATNRLGRILKTPKVQFLDSGLLATLTDAGAAAIERDRMLLGPLLESFAGSELIKQAGWAEDEYTFFYYRDKDGHEVDWVVENAAGNVIGIEVKAAASFGPRDLRGLRRLAELAGERFAAGVVLYDGEATMPVGERLWAVPLSTLWE